MYVNGRVKILPLNCQNSGLSLMTRIARSVGLEIQGCMRPISIFAQQIRMSLPLLPLLASLVMAVLLREIHPCRLWHPSLLFGSL